MDADLDAPRLVVVGGVSIDRTSTPQRRGVQVLCGGGLYAALAVATRTTVTLAGICSDHPLTAGRPWRAAVDDAGPVTLPGRRLPFDISYDSGSRATYRTDDAGDERYLHPVRCRRVTEPLPGCTCVPWATRSSSCGTRPRCAQWQPGRLGSARVRSWPGLPPTAARYGKCSTPATCSCARRRRPSCSPVSGSWWTRWRGSPGRSAGRAGGGGALQRSVVEVGS